MEVALFVPTGTIQAKVYPHGGVRELDAELIGQLAIHHLIWASGKIAGWALSHTASGYNLWNFKEWVALDDIENLAVQLLEQDFDGYYTAGCNDKAFVAACKDIFAAWEAKLPDRLAHDFATFEQEALS